MLSLWKYFIDKSSDDKETRSKRKGYLYWYLTSFPISEFKGEDKVIYDVFATAKDINSPIVERYIQVYIKSELKNFIAKNNVKIEETETLNYKEPVQLEEARVTISNVISADFSLLMEEDSNVDEFVIDAKSWMDDQRRLLVKKLASDSFETMNKLTRDGIGTEDAVSKIQGEINRISTMYSSKVLSELSEHVGMDVCKVCDSGIGSIDNVVKGFYTRDVVTIAAGPAVGKTTYTFGTLIYNALVISKVNVLAYCLEQSQKQMESLLIAKHIATLFNKTFDKNMIAKDLYKDDKESQKIIDIAEFDLFKSGKYGKICIKDNSNKFYLEEMESNFKEDEALHGPFNVIAIDHMAYIQQDPNAKGKRLDIGSIVSQGYINLKYYVSVYNKLGIAVNQLDRDGASLGKQCKEIEDKMFAGGMQTSRSSDFIFVLEATPQMTASNTVQMYTHKARSSAKPPRVTMDVWMASAVMKETVVKEDLAI